MAVVCRMGRQPCRPRGVCGDRPLLRLSLPVFAAQTRFVVWECVRCWVPCFFFPWRDGAAHAWGGPPACSVRLLVVVVLVGADACFRFGFSSIFGGGGGGGCCRGVMCVVHPPWDRRPCVFFLPFRCILVYHSPAACQTVFLSSSTPLFFFHCVFTSLRASPPHEHCECAHARPAGVAWRGATDALPTVIEAPSLPTLDPSSPHPPSSSPAQPPFLPPPPPPLKNTPPFPSTHHSIHQSSTRKTVDAPTCAASARPARVSCSTRPRRRWVLTGPPSARASAADSAGTVRPAGAAARRAPTIWSPLGMVATACTGPGLAWTARGRRRRSPRLPPPPPGAPAGGGDTDDTRGGGGGADGGGGGGRGTAGARTGDGGCGGSM